MKYNNLVNVFLPPNTHRRNFAKKILGRKKKNKNAITYKQWIKKYEPNLFKYRIDEKGPLISIVVPCYNTPEKYLLPLIDSVISQTYPNWQLCLVDASSDQKRSERIEVAARKDHRIVYERLNKNLGISGNTNRGIKIAEGEFVGLLDHDDTLSPHALEEVAIAHKTNPKADIFYSDEDKISDDGKERILPFFKPDWSPELLLGVNYITHFLVVRKTVLNKVKGLRPDFDGAQDYDLLLRLTEITDSIVHIPKILYHWRLAEGSTAKQVSEKDYATTAGRRALEEAMQRRGIKAEALEVEGRPTNYRPLYSLPKKQLLVSIIIPFKDKVELLKTCIPSILEQSSYNNYEIVLISNNSTEKATFDYLETLAAEKRCRILEWNHKFNYSAINNFGRDNAKGEYLIFLNNDTEIITPTWIEELIGVASQPQIGAVGPMLYYPNQTIQHAGVVLGMGGMAGHVFRGRKDGEWTDFGLTSWPRNFLAVTGACLAVNTAKFDMVAGFDEELTIGGNDVALCLSLHEKGMRNVFWPFAELIHYENVSVGPYKNSVPIGDYNRSLVYYKKYLEKGDPYFNPNLDLMNEQVGLGMKR